MSNRTNKDTSIQPVPQMPDLEGDAQELGMEDAESVRGGIIVQGGISPYQKVTTVDLIQLINWG